MPEKSKSKGKAVTVSEVAVRPGQGGRSRSGQRLVVGRLKNRGEGRLAYRPGHPR
jgi:hypothetical protein